jgi:hypothetical protein
MSGCSLSAGRTNSWPSGRIPDIEKLHCTVGLPSDHGRVRTFCQPDYHGYKMDRNIHGSKWPSGQGARRRDLPAHLNETFIPVWGCRRGDQISADFAALHESAGRGALRVGDFVVNDSGDIGRVVHIFVRDRDLVAVNFPPDPQGYCYLRTPASKDRPKPMRNHGCQQRQRKAGEERHD